METEMGRLLKVTSRNLPAARSFSSGLRAIFIHDPVKARTDNTSSPLWHRAAVRCATPGRLPATPSGHKKSAAGSWPARFSHGGERAAREEPEMSEEEAAPEERHPLHPEPVGAEPPVDERAGEKPRDHQEGVHREQHTLALAREEALAGHARFYRENETTVCPRVRCSDRPCRTATATSASAPLPPRRWGRSRSSAASAATASSAKGRYPRYPGSGISNSLGWSKKGTV